MSDGKEVKRYETSPGWYEINDVTEYNGASVRLKPSYTSSTEFKANLEDKQKEVSKDIFRQQDNMNRKAKLEKALADLPKRQFTLHGDPSDESSWKWEVNPPPQAFWDDGLYVDVDEMEFRLAPLHAALIEAVEALEYLKDDSQYGEYVKKALAKIDGALEQAKGET